MWPYLLGGAGLLLLLSTMTNSNGIGSSIASGIDSFVDYGRELAFAAVLPSPVSNYAQLILEASRSHGVSPWLLAGIMYRESLGGSALSPPGPGGTGDFGRRTPGMRYTNGYVVPGSGMPEDGQGWGRGLMQIDWASQFPWGQTNNWQDPATNIEKGAQVLAEAMSYFQQGPNPNGIIVTAGHTSGWGLPTPGPYMDPRPLSGTDLALAATAAYNAGPGTVLQAVAAGLSPDVATTGSNYSNAVASRAAAWLSNFS